MVSLATDAALGLTNLDDEVIVDELDLEGELPAWLGGSLLRTGPARRWRSLRQGLSQSAPAGSACAARAGQAQTRDLSHQRPAGDAQELCGAALVAATGDQRFGDEVPAGTCARR